MAFHDLLWPSMNFFDLLRPLWPSMIIKCLLARPELMSGPLQSSPAQINSPSNPWLDPIDSKSISNIKSTDCIHVANQASTDCTRKKKFSFRPGCKYSLTEHSLENYLLRKPSLSPRSCSLEQIATLIITENRRASEPKGERYITL